MTLLGLGMRLGIKGSRLRLAATALALGFAVAFLLAVLGALPARQAKLDRLAARSPINNRVSTAQHYSASAPVTTVDALFGWYRGRTITGWRVADARPGQPVPPGLRRLPRPGEMVVSPDLAAVLRGPRGGELATRLPGRVVATVSRAGLSGPHELLAWVGVARVANPQRTPGFGYRPQHLSAPPELRIAAQLGALGLLLPVLVLVATATRLSAATRDRRLAAIRLVGGSNRQVALLAAGEGLLLGLLGTALGLVVFLLLRPVAAALVPVDGGVFAEDVHPPVAQVVAVLLAVPLLSVLASLGAMRRLVTSPLEVRRAGRPQRAVRPWRLLPLVAGLALLGLLLTTDRWIAVSVLGGGALTVVGLALATPYVTRAVGVLLARSPGLVSSLAGRRIAADPGSTGRTLTGTVLVVFAGTWLLAFLPLLQTNQGSAERDLARLLPGTTLTAATGPAFDARALADLPGVRGVLAETTLQLATPSYRPSDQAPPPGAPEQQAQGVVVDCHALVRFLGVTADCGSARVHQVQLGTSSAAPSSPLVGPVGVLGPDGRLHQRLVLPAEPPALRLPDEAQGVQGLYAGTYLLDPSLVPAAQPDGSGQVLVRTDGNPSTVERVRAALPADAVFGAATLDELLAGQDRVVLGYLRAARLGLVLAVLVGSVSLLVTVVDEVSRRRRDLAALAALGVSRRVLQRVLLVQAAAPAVACTALAVLAGVWASVAYLAAPRRDGQLVSLPWAGWAAVSGVALLAVLAVTALTLPLARSAARPEHLRTT